jgi:RNA polymerase sigma-70 factor, ECF subfamily
LIELTELIEQVRAGDRSAEPLLYERIYPELHAIARQRLAGEQFAAESTESLVHECYLRLKKGGLPEVADRGHFFALVSRVMRQILVDFARSRTAQRRDQRQRVPIEMAEEVPDAREGNVLMVLELDEQLRELEKISAEAAQLVELRFFGGMSAEESAEYLGMDVIAVRKHLRFGQGWLRRAIAQK